ncbi:MAG: hypothetical protein ACRD2B_12615 [Terriglobia bacterium]
MNRREFVTGLATTSLGVAALTVSRASAGDGKNLKLAPYSAPRFDAWQVIGPGGGGSMYCPTVSPHDSHLVLTACDMTGIYISTDGGNSWRMFDLRRRAYSFAYDPNDSHVIYTLTDNLWRSVNRGRTWSLVYPPPASVKRLIMPGDEASPILETDRGPAERVTAIAIDPADSKTLFIVVGGRENSALYVSRDWGAHWDRKASLSGGGRQIYLDPQSPQSERTLYVVGSNSVSIRRAGRWIPCAPPAGVTRLRDSSAAFSTDGKLTIYAVANGRREGNPRIGGVFISDDGGVTWRQANDWFLRLLDPSAPFPLLSAVTTCLRHPEVAYVSYTGLRSPSGGSLHGVAKSSDRGRTWQLVWKEGEKEAPNIHDAWLDPRFGAGWGEPGFGLGVAPTNPDICYRSDEGALLRTTDGGRNWYAVYSKRLPDDTYTTTGLDVTSTHGVFFDPFDVSRVFIAYTDIGLFRSENGGRSWVSSTAGVPRRWVNTTYRITFDPVVKGRVWGVMSGIHDLPRSKDWRHRSPASYNGGVCISEDGGKTWRSSNQGMPSTATTDILLDPSSPVNARVLYVAGFGRGAFKSVDGGRTWSLRNNGLPEHEPFAWRIDRDKNGVLYLVIARRSDNGSFGNAEDGALYRSRDGADHWEKVPLPRGVNGPNWIAIDPQDASRLYLAVWGRWTPRGAVQGGIYLSTDAGKSWRNVLSRDQHVYAVTVDRHSPRTVYAAGFESSAWRSDDRGETWRRIDGFNFKWGQEVILDPTNPGKIFIGTYGGSVWYGPAKGDPKAVQDIVTPVVAYGR